MRGYRPTRSILSVLYGSNRLVTRSLYTTGDNGSNGREVVQTFEYTHASQRYERQVIRPLNAKGSMSQE